MTWIATFARIRLLQSHHRSLISHIPGTTGRQRTGMPTPRTSEPQRLRSGSPWHKISCPLPVRKNRTHNRAKPVDLSPGSGRQKTRLIRNIPPGPGPSPASRVSQTWILLSGSEYEATWVLQTWHRPAGYMIFVIRSISTRPGIKRNVEEVRYCACWKQEEQGIRSLLQPSRVSPVDTEYVCSINANSRVWA